MNTAMTQHMLDAQYEFGTDGDPADPAVSSWVLFIEEPSPQTFWLAHSLSLYEAHNSYEAQLRLAEENVFEQAFVNDVVVPAALAVGPIIMAGDGGLTSWVDAPGDWSWFWDPSGNGVDWFTDNVYSAVPYVPPGILPSDPYLFSF